MMTRPRIFAATMPWRQTLVLVGCLLVAPGLSAQPANGRSASTPANGIERPLTGGPAWNHANNAYRAYERKDYAAAEQQVERALASRPDVSRLWLLLVYALQNQGKLDEAIQAAERAQAGGHANAALLRAKDTLVATRQAASGSGLTTQDPSWAAADQAYRLYASGDYAQAETQAREALRLGPANASLQALLAYSLERQGKVDQATREVELALAGDPSNQTLLALRDRLNRLTAQAPATVSWKAYQQRDFAQAIAQARLALASAPDVSSYQSLLQGGLLATGQYAEVEAAATAALAQDAESAVAMVLRGYARTQLGDAKGAQTDFSTALKQDWLSDYELASLTRIAADADAQRVKPDAMTLVPKLVCSPVERDVVCSITPGRGGVGGGPGFLEADDAFDAYAKQDYAQSAALAQKAMEQAPGNLSYRLLFVNAAARAGEREGARAAFAPLLAPAAVIPPDSLLDAAYAAQRLSYRDKSVEWFTRALNTETIELTPQSRYNIRRAISETERRWGFNAGVGFGTVGVVNPAFAPSLSERRTMQGSAEVYWRPPIRDLPAGTNVELYARVNESLYDGTGGNTGSTSLQGVLGARWKPLGTQNFVFAAERFVKLGNASREDWLLRAAWSEGEGGDLRVDVPSWRYWQLYAEADYFVENPQTLGTAEARFGRSYRVDQVSPNMVLTPFVSLAANYDSDFAERATLGVGPGVSMRYWFRQDRTHAPLSYVDFNLQYRFRVAGADRSNGVFASMFFSY